MELAIATHTDPETWMRATDETLATALDVFTEIQARQDKDYG